eukprot:XP_001703212.1 predicted protein [Chlamydomonas reinhardtii]
MDVSSLWAEASEEVEPSLASTGGEEDRSLVTRVTRTRTRSAAAPSTAPPHKRTQLQQPAPPSTPDRAQPLPQYAPSDVSSASTAPHAAGPFNNVMSAAALSSSAVPTTMHATPQRTRPSAPPSTPAQPGPASGTSGGGGLVLVPSRELQVSGDLAAALEAELQEIERKYIDAGLPPRRSSPGSTRRWSAAQSPAASAGGASAVAQRPSSVSRHYQLHRDATHPLHPHHAHHHQHHQHHILHQRAAGYRAHEQHEPGLEAAAHAQPPLMPAASTLPPADASAGLACEPVPLPSRLLTVALPGLPAAAVPAPDAASAGAARSLLSMFAVDEAPGAAGMAKPGNAAEPAPGAQASHVAPGAAPSGAQGGKPATDTLTQLLSRLQQQHLPLGQEEGAGEPGSPAVRALGQGLQTVHGAYDRLESRVRELRALVGGSPHSSAPHSTAASARSSPGRSEAGRVQAVRMEGSPAQAQPGATTAASSSGGGARGASVPGGVPGVLLHTLAGVSKELHGASGEGTGGASADLSSGHVGSATRALDMLLGLSLVDGLESGYHQQRPAAVAGAADTASDAVQVPAALGVEAVVHGTGTWEAVPAGIPAHVLRPSPGGSSGGGSHATGSRSSTAAGMRASGWMSTPTATSTTSGGDASASLASEVTLRNTPQQLQAPQLSHLGERHRQQQSLPNTTPLLPAQQQPQPDHQHYFDAASRPQRPQEEGRQPRISDADALVPLVGQGREEELQSGIPLSCALPDGGAAVMEARARLAAATAASARTAAAAAAAAKAAEDDDAAREAARNQPPPPVFQTVLAADRPARLHGRPLGALDAYALLPPAHVTSVIRPLLHLARDSEAAADADCQSHRVLSPDMVTQPSGGGRQADEQSRTAAAAAAARAEEEALELLEALEWSVAADAAALDDEFLAVLGRRLGHLDLAHGAGDAAASSATAMHSAAGQAAGAGFGGPAAAAVAAAMAAATGSSGGGQGLETELLRAARQTALGAVQSRLEQLQVRYASKRRHRRVASTSSAAARPEAMAAVPAAAAAGVASGAAAGETPSPAAAAAGVSTTVAGFARSPRYGAPTVAAHSTPHAAHPPQPAAARRLYAANSSLTPPAQTAASFPHASIGAGSVGSPLRGPVSQHLYAKHSDVRLQISSPRFTSASKPSPAASLGYSSQTPPSAGGATTPEAADAAAGTVACSSGSGPVGGPEGPGLQLPAATTPEELEELRALCDMARHLPQLGPLERVQLWGRVGEVLAHKLARANPVEHQHQQRGGIPDRPAGGSRYATPVKATAFEAEEQHASGDAESPGTAGRGAGEQQWGSLHSGGSLTRGYAAVWERRQNSTGSRGQSMSPARGGEGSDVPGNQSPGAAAASPTHTQPRSPGPVAASAAAAAPATGMRSPGGAGLLDSTMEVVHRLIAPNATLAQAMSLNWKAVRTHLASQEAAASPQRLALSPKH